MYICPKLGQHGEDDEDDEKAIPDAEVAVESRPFAYVSPVWTGSPELKGKGKIAQVPILGPDRTRYLIIIPCDICMCYFVLRVIEYEMRNEKGGTEKQWDITDVSEATTTSDHVVQGCTYDLER